MHVDEHAEDPAHNLQGDSHPKQILVSLWAFLVHLAYNIYLHQWIPFN
jgi:hypothetical protein